MAHDKSEIVTDVLREHYGHCFHYIAKEKGSSTNHIPTPAAARNTPFERVTSIVDDVSIIINMFGMGDYQPTGRDLVNFLLGNVKRAFEHENIHTYVLAADMSCFGVEAKEALQADRLTQARTQAAIAKIRPHVWDIDDPEPIVDLNRKMPVLLAMQSSPGVVRQALFEAMTLIPVVYQPPAGKRLILSMEPRQYTNPASIDDFMPTDPSTGIVIKADSVDKVEAAREEMRELVSKLDKRAWRKAAREKTTALAKAGCFVTIPLCCEMDVVGLMFEPFRLIGMPLQVGEADLAIQRIVTYLQTSVIVDRLAGERKPLGVDAFKQFYTEEQLQQHDMPNRVGKMSFWVGDGGRKCIQCPAVMSTDSDFCMLLVFTIAILVAEQQFQHGNEPNRFEMLLTGLPLLIRGDVLTRTRDTIKRGERRMYFPKPKIGLPDPALLSSHEIFDPAAFYAELVYGPKQTKSSLSLVIEDAAMRQQRTAEKRAATLILKKRSASTGESTEAEPAVKKSKTASGKSVSSFNAQEQQEAEDDEAGGAPLMHVPPPHNMSVQSVFEHVASFVMFTCMLGNDYLAGVRGSSRKWSYAAYVEMMQRYPQHTLVQVLPQPAGQPPISPARSHLFINCGVHQRLIGFCYYMNLMAQACTANKPTIPIDRITIDEVASAVSQKFSKPNKQVPDGKTRARMAMRLYWVLKYFLHGSTTIRHIIDPLEFGWEGEWRHIIL